MPPGLAALSAEIQRATGTESSSCSDLGNLIVFVTPRRFVTPGILVGPADVAWEIEIVDAGSTDSNYPTGSTPAIYPYLWSGRAYYFVLPWGDSAPAMQRAIRLAVTVTAVDRWGRRSQPCTVVVQHIGRLLSDERTTGGPIACN